jgi:hypothetical protein
MSPQRDQMKAEGYFDGALTLARQQQAKSWELRASLTQSNIPEPTAKPLLDKLSLFDAAQFSGRHRLLSVG